MEYAKTKDILHVMKTLSHKRIENTLIYTQLIKFESDEYICKVAKGPEEIAKLKRRASNMSVNAMGLSSLERGNR